MVFHLHQTFSHKYLVHILGMYDKYHNLVPPNQFDIYTLQVAIDIFVSRDWIEIIREES